MVNYLIFMQKGNGKTRTTGLRLNEKRERILSSGRKNFLYAEPPVACISICRLSKTVNSFILIGLRKFFVV
jgi:hypothetical protein